LLGGSNNKEYYETLGLDNTASGKLFDCSMLNCTSCRY
jgi:hypothetical protein